MNLESEAKLLLVCFFRNATLARHRRRRSEQATVLAMDGGAVAVRAPTISHSSRQRSAWRSRDDIVDCALSLEVALASTIDETRLLAWQNRSGMKLVVPLGTRCSQATKLVPQGTLVRRMLYGIRAGNSLVGCAELLLVRKPPIPQASLCRICLDDGEEGSFDDDDTLNQTVLTA